MEMDANPMVCFENGVCRLSRKVAQRPFLSLHDHAGGKGQASKQATLKKRFMGHFILCLVRRRDKETARHQTSQTACQTGGYYFYARQMETNMAY